MAVGAVGVAHLTIHQAQDKHFAISLDGRTAAVERRFERDSEAMMAAVRTVAESEATLALLGSSGRDQGVRLNVLSWAAEGSLDGVLLLNPGGEVAGKVGDIPDSLALEPAAVELLERGAGSWWSVTDDETYQVVMTPVSDGGHRRGLVLGARSLQGARLATLSDEVGVDLALLDAEHVRESVMVEPVEGVGGTDPLGVLTKHRVGEDEPHRLSLAGRRFMVQELQLGGGQSLGLALMLPMESFGSTLTTALKRLGLLALLVGILGVGIALFNARKVSVPLEGLVGVSRRAADGDLGPVRQQSTTTELAILEDALSDMLRQQRRHQERVAKRVRKDRDKEIGRWIAQSVSMDAPDLAGFDLAVGMWRAEEAKGDGYNLFEALDGSLWITLCDAAASGLRAGMLSTLLRGALESAVRASAEATPSSILQALDPVVSSYLETVDWPHHFVALRVVKIGMNGQLLYAGAHEEMIVLRADNGSTEHPTWTGAWLGLGATGEDDDPDGEVKLETGDSLILYTDGLYSGMDQAGRLLGTNRLNDIAEQAAGQPSRVIVDRLMGQWEKWVEHPLDDATVIVVRRRAGV